MSLEDELLSPSPKSLSQVGTKLRVRSIEIDAVHACLLHAVYVCLYSLVGLFHEALTAHSYLSHLKAGAP